MLRLELEVLCMHSELLCKRLRGWFPELLDHGVMTDTFPQKELSMLDPSCYMQHSQH